MRSFKFCQLRHLLLAGYRLTNFQGKVNGKKHYKSGFIGNLLYNSFESKNKLI